MCEWLHVCVSVRSYWRPAKPSMSYCNNFSMLIKTYYIIFFFSGPNPQTTNINTLSRYVWLVCEHAKMLISTTHKVRLKQIRMLFVLLVLGHNSKHWIIKYVSKFAERFHAETERECLRTISWQPVHSCWDICCWYKLWAKNLQYPDWRAKFVVTSQGLTKPIIIFTYSMMLWAAYVSARVLAW